nr:MAG TPA: hypothetical protein [Caudoviricetes sp.]
MFIVKLFYRFLLFSTCFPQFVQNYQNNHQSIVNISQIIKISEKRVVITLIKEYYKTIPNEGIP